MWFTLYVVTSFLFHLSTEFHIDVTKNENILYNGNKVRFSNFFLCNKIVTFFFLHLNL